MALERRKAPKTETLTIRLDPKTRFALEFVARLKGQSITTVVERAIKKTADDTNVGDAFDGANWSNFWDPNDGIRTILMAMDAGTFPSFDDEEKLDFVKSHWPFFASQPNLLNLRRESFEILWPSIDELLAEWRQRKGTDRMFVGEVMQKSLMSAKASFIPAWPIPQKAPKTASSLDDEIPF